MRSTTRSGRDQPFAWWGPVWVTPTPRSIVDLIDDGSIEAETAALLWALLVRRASLIVVAGPSGAGKTTLLTALLPFLPPESRRIFLRGCYESFAFVSDPSIDPESSVLLVNEISPHLPIYLWGGGVERALDAVRGGFTLVATAHAQSATELVARLGGYPLRVPARLIAAADLVVVLDAWRTPERIVRLVRSVETLSHDAATDAVAVAPLLARSRPGEPGSLLWPAIEHTSARWEARGVPPLGQNELAQRVNALQSLRSTRPHPVPLDQSLADWQDRWRRTHPND